MSKNAKESIHHDDSGEGNSDWIGEEELYADICV